MVMAWERSCIGIGERYKDTLPTASRATVNPQAQHYVLLLFRLFDIWKPFPIGYFDRTVKGGFGVMLDDLLAAGYALLVLGVISWWMQIK